MLSFKLEIVPKFLTGFTYSRYLLNENFLSKDDLENFQQPQQQILASHSLRSHRSVFMAAKRCKAEVEFYKFRLIENLYEVKIILDATVRADLERFLLETSDLCGHESRFHSFGESHEFPGNG